MRKSFVKKTLITLAVLAAAGAAMAQSSVSLFGTVDVSVRYTDHATAGRASRSLLDTSGNSISRIGLRGAEDLGAGLKLGFWLEGELFADTGNPNGLDFKRRSTISLEGGFGELRLGRDMTAGYSKTSAYDVFAQAGRGQFWAWTENWLGAVVPGAYGDESGIRANNLVSYYTPDFSGFKAGLSYSFKENAGNKAGRYVGGNVSYDSGPISVAVSYDRVNIQHFGLDPVVLVPGQRDAFTVGGSYNFGLAKLSGIAQQQKYKFDGHQTRKINSYALGVSAPVSGVGEVKLQYAFYDLKAFEAQGQQLSFGYEHKLSKRTAVYGTVSHMKVKPSPGMAVWGSYMKTVFTHFEAGIRHNF